jgi:hypothetical protein
VHWEIFDTQSGKRLNPSLFVNHIADTIAPTVVRIAVYNRNFSTFDQNPKLIKLIKSDNTYGTSEGTIKVNFNQLSFAVQAYDTRNGTANRDGIYSARLFFDNKEISSFYIDSLSYGDTRYMNAQVDYKMVTAGGAWMQHVQKLPGDHSGLYHDLGDNAIINLQDTLVHDVKIIVGDAAGNNATIRFTVKNTGAAEPQPQRYEWLPNQLNSIFKNDFEAYLSMYSLYDKMNSGYSRKAGTAANSVSDAHKLGENNLPIHTWFEIRIKPNKSVAAENKNKVVIKRTSGNKSEMRKAAWNGNWITAQFKEFGTFEALIDTIPPKINPLGTGEKINLDKAKSISFTPTDNTGIADFRAELDGKWLRFTNDKGRTWTYFFDSRVSNGTHELKVIVTDIAGNKTEQSWKFSRNN